MLDAKPLACLFFTSSQLRFHLSSSHRAHSTNEERSDMDHVDGRELPPAVHEGPFSYSRRGFYFSAEPYVQRHAGQDLKEILNKPVETKRQRSTIRPLISAHLAFYGVQSNHDQRWRANLELLKNAAEAGQVRLLSIPPGTYLTAINSQVRVPSKQCFRDSLSASRPIQRSYRKILVSLLGQIAREIS